MCEFGTFKENLKKATENFDHNSSSRWQILTYFAAFRPIRPHNSNFSAATTLKFGMYIYDDQYNLSR